MIRATLDNLCQKLPANVVDAAEVCSQAIYFDEELATQLIHTFTSSNGSSRTVFSKLKDLPFVFPHEDHSWRFSEYARKYFVDRGAENGNPASLDKISAFLAQFYDEKLSKHTELESFEAREQAYQRIFHLVPVDPASGLDALVEYGERASQAGNHADVKSVLNLFEARSPYLSKFSRERNYFEGRYAYANRNPSVAERKFRAVWKAGVQDNIMAISGHLLGKILANKNTEEYFRQAEQLFRTSISISKKTGNLRGASMAEVSLGGVLLRLGGKQNELAAEKLFRDSLSYRERQTNPDLRDVAIAQNSLGGILLRIGGATKIEEAEELLRSSLALGKELGMVRHTSQVQMSLAKVLTRKRGQKQLEEAEELLRESLATRKELGDDEGVAMVENSLGLVLINLGGRDRLEQAEKLYRSSLAWEMRYGTTRGRGMVQNSLGNLLFKLGGKKNITEAEQLFRASIEDARGIGNLKGVALISNRLSKLLEESGKLKEAIYHLEEAIKVDTKLENAHFVEQGLRKLNQLQRKLKNGA